MGEKETKITEVKVREGFEMLGLGANYERAYPGSFAHARQYKRCSILREVPTTYSSSTILK